MEIAVKTMVLIVIVMKVIKAPTANTTRMNAHQTRVKTKENVKM